MTTINRIEVQLIGGPLDGKALTHGCVDPFPPHRLRFPLLSETALQGAVWCPPDEPFLLADADGNEYHRCQDGVYRMETYGSACYEIQLGKDGPPFGGPYRYVYRCSEPAPERRWPGSPDGRWHKPDALGVEE